MSESQIKTEVPELPATHKAKEWKHWYPGKIGFANAVGHFSGCMLKIFHPEQMLDGDTHETVEASEVANRWFAANPGMLVVEVLPMSNTSLLVVFTKILSPEEYDENNEIMHEVSMLREKRSEERAARQAAAEEPARLAREKAAEEATAAEKELKRLAELGKRHERNCKKEVA